LDNLLIAFSLTLFAGASTGIGSLMALFSKNFNTKFLCASLGFSAGVMIYVSFVEIFIKAKISLIEIYGDSTGYSITVLSFFIGIFFIAVIDKFVPETINPHEMKTPNDRIDDPKLMRMGVFTAVAIAIHNFPEGLATFISALKDPFTGISITAAIAIHNIPEGIAVSIPVYFATRNKKKAFLYSFLSGMAEPVGALLGYFLLIQIFADSLFGVVFAFVAGIMVYISLDELLPAAEKYGEHHIAIYGLISGMAVMASSLLLFLPS